MTAVMYLSSCSCNSPERDTDRETCKVMVNYSVRELKIVAYKMTL